MIKILHLSDLQLEVRRSSQRHDEYSDALSQIIAAVKADLAIRKITITGDIFEFCSVTDTERLMFIKFIREMDSISTIDEIVITSGNHDLKQRFNDIQISGVQVIESSVMDTLHETFIKHEKVNVFTSSGFYPSITDGLNWGVWAHEHKFDGNIEKYNPWNNEIVKINPLNVIELYHDDFTGALNFNGQTQKGCEDAIGFSDFKAKTILAGHIHNPQQFTSETGQVFTYASSPVMRDYGEGDYYMNTNRSVDGNSKHGFYIHEVDENDGFKTVSSVFHTVTPYTTRTTINIDKNFDYGMLEFFKLVHVSKNKNLFRLNVIGNEAKYHENSQKIMESIRSQAPNAEIVVEIDSSSIFSDTTEELDLELDKLVTEEQILELAIPFIKRRIRSTKRILEEDKESAENTTIDMFKTQLLKLRKNIVRNNISFKKLKISNFLSFEDNVELDISQLKSLVKVSGTNGIGKTNIMKVIKWIIDDVIDSSQARNTTNQNAIEVFNDKRLDTNLVSSEFLFTNNGTIYTLTKSVERFFKTRSNDITVHNWKEHLKNVQISKTLRIQTLDSDTTLVDIDVIQAELKSIFGTVTDLEALLFTNATLLDRLVKSNPDVLADQIMYHLGLRYFQDMAADYENLREEKLKTLSKPSETIEALLIQSTELKEVQENGDVQKEELTATKTTQDAELLVLNTQIADLSSTLHQINDSLETIDQSIENKQKSLKLSIDTFILEGDNIKKSKEAFALITDDFSDRIEKEIENKQLYQKEIDTAANGVTVITAELDTIKGKAREHANTVKAELQKAIDDKFSVKSTEHRVSLQNKETEKSTLTDSLRTIKHTLELEIQSEKTQINTAVTKSETELSTTQGKIKTDEQMLNIYKTSTNCSECKRDLTGDALTEIQTRITERETAIQESKATEIQQLETLSNNRKLLDFPKFITPDLYISETLKTKNSDSLTKLQTLTTEIAEINTSISTLDAEKVTEESKINELVKVNAVVIKAIADITSKNTELETATKNLEDVKLKNEQILSEIDTKVSGIRSEKENYQTHKTNIEKSEESNTTRKNDIEKLEISIKALEADKVKLDENEITKGKINVVKEKVTQLTANITETSEKLYQIVIKLESAKINLVRIQNDIEDLIKYRIMDASLAIYKTFISKSGLNKLVFEAVSKKLNVHMNDLLQESPYKLAFIGGVLHLIDSKNPDMPVMRTAPAFSGMQIILGGLSLFYVLRNASLGTKFDSVFIDEISGPLNDGKDLTYAAIDYKELLVKMIAKMRDTSKIFIVDHVLDFYDGSVLEVYPSTDGANIKEIAVPQT